MTYREVLLVFHYAAGNVYSGPEQNYERVLFIDVCTDCLITFRHIYGHGEHLLFFFSVTIAGQGNDVKIPVILGCAAPGLLYAYGNSLTIWTFLSL